MIKLGKDNHAALVNPDAIAAIEALNFKVIKEYSEMKDVCCFDLNVTLFNGTMITSHVEKKFYSAGYEDETYAQSCLRQYCEECGIEFQD